MTADIPDRTPALRPGASRRSGWAIAACCFLLAGCGKQTASYRPFVPPSVPPQTTPSLPDPPEIALVAPDLPVLTAEIQIAAPTETGVAIAEARAQLAQGERALEQGRLAGARLAFDRAVAAILHAPAAPAEFQQTHRAEVLAEITARIRELDAVHLASRQTRFIGPASDAFPAPAKRTFPVDPAADTPFDARVRQDIAALPIEMNPSVAEYISFFSAGEGRKVLEVGLKSSGRYREMIERVFAEYGLPSELVYLAQVESKFDPTAISAPRCCVGLWQFGRDSGEENGLLRTDFVDERRDPELATRAAARHLYGLYERYSDWYLAMAAYNCGPGCLDRAIMNTGYADFWDLRELRALPRETANYVPQVLAMAIVLKDPAAYGIVDPAIDQPIRYENHELVADTSLALIAAAVGRPVEEIQEINPALLKDVAPAGYLLHLPEGARERFEEATAVIPPSMRTSWRLHRVFDGDTIPALAEQYKVSAAAILDANHGGLPTAGSWAVIPKPY